MKTNLLWAVAVVFVLLCSAGWWLFLYRPAFQSTSRARYDFIPLAQTSVLRVDRATGHAWFSVGGGEWRAVADADTNVLLFVDAPPGYEPVTASR